MAGGSGGAGGAATDATSSCAGNRVPRPYAESATSIIVPMPKSGKMSRRACFPALPLTDAGALPGLRRGASRSLRRSAGILMR